MKGLDELLVTVKVSFSPAYMDKKFAPYWTASPSCLDS